MRLIKARCFTLLFLIGLFLGPIGISAHTDATDENSGNLKSLQNVLQCNCSKCDEQGSNPFGISVGNGGYLEICLLEKKAENSIYLCRLGMIKKIGNLGKVNWTPSWGGDVWGESFDTKSVKMTPLKRWQLAKDGLYAQKDNENYFEIDFEVTSEEIAPFACDSTSTIHVNAHNAKAQAKAMKSKVTKKANGETEIEMDGDAIDLDKSVFDWEGKPDAGQMTRLQNFLASCEGKPFSEINMPVAD